MNKIQILGLIGIMLVSSPIIFANDDFAQWQIIQQQSFQTFKDERDREFTSFLKKRWRKMQLRQGSKRDNKPKPKLLPIAKLKPLPKPTHHLPRIKPPVLKPVQIIRPPVIVKPPKGKSINTLFYGHRLQFPYESAFKTRFGRNINKKTISNYWANLSKADYKPLLLQLKKQHTALRLNDWAYVLLIHQLVKRLHPNRPTEQTLITWFLLTKGGYQARIAYDKNKVYLLMPTKQALYGVSFFTFDKKRYYAIHLDGSRGQQLGQVYTYDAHYPRATKVLDMRLSTALATLPQYETKHLTFRYGGKSHHLKINYDKQTVEFFRTYPQLDISMYFSSVIQPKTSKQLLERLKPLVIGKSELDAINLLLGFVQTAFEYKTDKAQFGEENYLFPEETLFYPYSDCEDRSILFAWLVKNLLGLEVIGLDYPGHIATAVRFNGKVNGMSIRYQGRRYMITDPTFINARAGMVMPQFKKTNPKVIKF